MPNKTKIIATIGPSSNTKTVLKRMISAGMNVARLNFSHGTYEQHGEVVDTIRSLSKEMNKPVAIMLDLQGPKIRTGELVGGNPVLLKNKDSFSITSKDIPGTNTIVSTTYKHLPQDVKEGDKILIDDGLIELKVCSKTRNTVSCRVIVGGPLKEHKGINLPGVDVSAPSLTEKDVKDLKYGVEIGVDYFALSFVRSAKDLKHIKSIIKKCKADIPVIAKIEKPEAVDNFDEILEVTDAVMVARGDLGVELRPELVPNIQKQIIAKTIQANKPVITATQMLETMCNNAIPTRAEASDVANAIFDGTDAVMLSGETASGKYPVKAVQMMSRIAAQAEESSFMKYNIQYEKDVKNLVVHAVAQSAVNIHHEVEAKAIIAFSVSGKTSKLISKQRPSSPVYAFSPSKEIFNRLSLVWGVTPFLIDPIHDATRLIEEGEKILIERKHIKKNDLVIIVTGLALTKGSTNLIKLHTIGRKD
ncbi:MAG: pyruvate kinase [Proteobacteria bacterium]|nr:pyruvate kinase [Pseudomonadota bacterium]